MQKNHEAEGVQEFSFKSLFVPFTTSKAIHWIIIIGFIVYGNMLFNGFVWDDVGYIISNQTIHQFDVLKLFGENEFNSGGYFRPIPAVYFSLLYQMSGTQPFLYHFIQLCLHIINACIVYIFFKRFFPNIHSFLLTLIFLVHPVQVESVSYIGAAQSELFFLFGIIALMISMQSRLSYAKLFLLAFFLLCSLLTKETGFLFILMILAMQLLIQRKRIMKIVPYLIGVGLLYSVIRFFFVGVFLEKNTSSPIGLLPLSERIVHIPVVFFHYLKILFYPVTLGIDQRWIIKSFDAAHMFLPILFSLLFLVCIGICIRISRKRSNELHEQFLFFAFWFFCGIGMLMQIFPLDMTVADRWMYFPLVGLLGMIGITLQLLLNKKGMRYGLFVLGICILLLSIRTIVRNTNWVNALTLYSHDIQVDDNYDLQNYLGAEYAMQGRFHEALPYLQKGVKNYPHATNLYNLGVAYENLKDYQKSGILLSSRCRR